MKIEASESIDQSKEDNKYNINSDNNSAAGDGVVTIVPVGNSSSNVLDLTKTSSVFPSDNKLESQDWLRTGSIQLTQEDKSKILRGKKLNNLVINFVQKLLKKQFLSLKGLQSTLMQYKSPKASNDGSAPQVQVIHCHGDHWIVGSTVHSGSLGNVQMYDSLYDDIDGETVDVVSCLFGLAAISEMITIPKQDGVKDCGVYFLANLTALCYKMDPAVTHFNQDLMRLYLIQCMEGGACMPFPLVEEIPG